MTAAPIAPAPRNFRVTLANGQPTHTRGGFVTEAMCRQHGGYAAARAFLAASMGHAPMAQSVATAEASRSGEGGGVTPRILKRARANVIASKRWGTVCERAIEHGHWDAGYLVQNAIAELMKKPVEGEG